VSEISSPVVEHFSIEMFQTKYTFIVVCQAGRGDGRGASREDYGQAEVKMSAVHVFFVLFSQHPLAAWVIFIASYVVFALGRFPGTHIDRPAASVEWSFCFPTL
jgi:hypothetical protein